MSSEVDRCLRRASLAGDGGAFVAVLGKRARAAAAAGARPGGPLDDFTVAVKDLIAVGGLPILAGSASRAEAVVETVDAPVVSSLLAAGAVLIGTTTLHELAFGVTGVNGHQGTPRNPRDPARVPGGSSSGAAVAVAEGSARVAIGTDTGGSVRIPAGLCGVVGFKPSHGNWPIEGVLPLSPTLDHLGVIAGRVADAAAVHQIFDDRVAEVPAQISVGVLVDEIAVADGAVARPIERALDALERAGCTLHEVRWPETARVLEASTTIMFAEAARWHRSALLKTPDRLGDDVRKRLEEGAWISATDYLRAREAAAEIRDAALSVLMKVDVVVGPTVPILPPLHSEAGVSGPRLVENTRLGNLTGLPAITLPVEGEALSVGLQLVAARDDRLLALAERFEATIRSMNSGPGDPPEPVRFQAADPKGRHDA